MFSLSSYAGELVTIETPRGAKLELLVDVPTTDKPVPAILIAPGQGYHMRLPLFERMVEVAKANGIGVVRFNWAYFTADPKSGKPSDKLVRELEDMNVALAWLRNSRKFDLKRVAIAGKSLGSIVAWQVFDRDAEAGAVLLLTPVCIDTSQERARDSTTENYVGLESVNRPLLLLAGDTDPLCPTEFLYVAAARLKTSPRVVVVGGDHGFGDKTAKDFEKTRSANLDLAARSSIDFVLKQFTQR
jgi:hypothetical protein